MTGRYLRLAMRRISLFLLLIGCLCVEVALARAATIDCQNVEATLSASPASIVLGTSATLHWSVTGPIGCVRGLTLDNVRVSATGSKSVTPDRGRAYSLVMTVDKARQVIANTSVAVTMPTLPADTSSRVVLIKGSTGLWRDYLKAAVNRSNTTVRLAPTIDMDLTGTPFIYVGSNVTLTSEYPQDDHNAPPASERVPPIGQSLVPGRSPTKPGPRLRVTNQVADFFRMRCSGEDVAAKIRFFGFRLHGPHFGTEKGTSRLERAIRITSCRGVEIANMEIAGWSGSGIMIEELIESGHLLNVIRNFSDISIHDNFIHHNQHEGDNGYGVAVEEGAWAWIARNVFDHNRHAIKADGKAGTNYYAIDNLVLKGGGYHQNYPGYTAYTHQFDVHGDQNCRPGGHQWDCGNAGDRFDYIRNSFQYTKTYAIKIRGKPRGLATINNNVFAHSSVDDAVDGGGFGNIVVGHGQFSNLAGIDSYGRYGVCDFDGDGVDDLFLPTGATWWFKAGARLHWVFMKEATERLGALALGYFDGKRGCDVLRKVGATLQVSSGGRGAWVALPGSYPMSFAEFRFADFNADGRTDIFRRDANQEWSIVSPGVYDWRTINSSIELLSNLKFGDFDGDNITDVVKRSNATWSISRNGTALWDRLNRNLPVGSHDRILVADADNDGKDDILRFIPSYVNSQLDGGTWQVSWSGVGNWNTLAAVVSPTSPTDEPRQVAVVVPSIFVGRFDASPGADPLFVDKYRMSSVLDRAKSAFVPLGAYPY